MVQRPASEPGEDFGATLRSMPRFCCRPRRVIGLLVAAGILFVAAHSFSLPEYNYSSPAGAYAEIDPDSPTPLSISQENADTKPDADPWLEEAELRTIMERDAEANTRFQSEQAIIRDQILKSLGPAVIGSGPSPAPPSALPAAKVEAGGAAAQGYTAGTALNSLPSPPPPPPPLIIGPAIPSPLQAAPTPVPPPQTSLHRCPIMLTATAEVQPSHTAFVRYRPEAAVEAAPPTRSSTNSRGLTHSRSARSL